MSDIFDIPGDIVRTAEDQQSFKLSVPPNARRHRREPNTFFWTESGVISSASSSSYTNSDTNQKVSTLTFEVSINAEGSGLNTNRPISATLRMNADAMRTGEPKKQVTMTLMSVAKMKALFRALSISADLPDGGFSRSLITRFFPPAESQFPTDTSELIGQTIFFEVKQGPRELPDGSLRESPEINRIIPEAEIG
jgi:hypothetical protein